MADEPFDPDKYLATPPAKPSIDFNPDEYLKPKEPAQYTGMLLPFRRDQEGIHFDPNAGLLGALKRPFDFTYDVRTGKIPADPRNPAYIGGALDTALTYGPLPAASRVGRGAVTAPSVNALDEAAVTGFKNYRNSGQMYGGQEYRDMLQGAIDRMRQEGLTPDPASASVPHGVLRDELTRVKNAPFVTSQDLDALRVQLSGAKLRDQQSVGNQVARDELFGYIDKNLPPNSDRSVRDAVANYRQARHSEAVTAPAEATAEKNIAKAQGPNLTAEQTRTNIANLINARKGEGPKGFSETEMNILRSANRATPGIDRMQRWGDALAIKSGGGFGYGGMAGFGGLTTAGGLLAAGQPGNAAALVGASTVPAIGAAVARSYANRGARNIAAEVDNAIRAQSPLAREQWATSPPLNAGFGARTDAPLGPRQTLSGGVIDAAMEARRRDMELRRQMIPPTYRVLPDGTVEELS